MTDESVTTPPTESEKEALRVRLRQMDAKLAKAAGVPVPPWMSGFYRLMHPWTMVMQLGLVTFEEQLEVAAMLERLIDGGAPLGEAPVPAPPPAVEGEVQH